MSNYRESKDKLNKIRSEYTCKGDVVFTTAVQFTIEVGQATMNGETWFTNTLARIDKRHDDAEEAGKYLFMTRDFEKAIVECARKLAEINTHDLMVYIQREMYLNNGLMDGEPDYKRAIEIIKSILSTEEYYCEYCAGGERFVDKLEEFGLREDEIYYFGYRKYIDEEEEDE